MTSQRRLQHRRDPHTLKTYHHACQLARKFIKLVKEHSPPGFLRSKNTQIKMLETAATMNSLAKGISLSASPGSSSSDIPSESDYDGISEGRLLLEELRELQQTDYTRTCDWDDTVTCVLVDTVTCLLEDTHTCVLHGPHICVLHDFQDLVRLSRRSLGSDDDTSQSPRFNPRLSIAILHDQDRFPEWRIPLCTLFAPIGFVPEFESAQCIRARIEWDQEANMWLDGRHLRVGETREGMRDVYDTRRGLRRTYNHFEEQVGHCSTVRGVWFHCGGRGVAGRDGGPCIPSCCPVHPQKMSRSTAVNEMNSTAR